MTAGRNMLSAGLGAGNRKATGNPSRFTRFPSFNDDRPEQGVWYTTERISKADLIETINDLYEEHGLTDEEPKTITRVLKQDIGKEDRFNALPRTTRDLLTDNALYPGRSRADNIHFSAIRMAEVGYSFDETCQLLQAVSVFGGYDTKKFMEQVKNGHAKG